MSTILKPIFKFKCPRCREGEVFKGGFSYSFSKITDMHEHCPKCKLKYEREPGFFYGAMYVSYALTVALWIAIAVAFFVLFGRIYPWIYMLTGIISLLVLLPAIYRLSRVLWLVMFVAYKPESLKDSEQVDPGVGRGT